MIGTHHMERINVLVWLTCLIGQSQLHPMHREHLHQPQLACAVAHMQLGTPHEHPRPPPGLGAAVCHVLYGLADSYHCCPSSKSQHQLHSAYLKSVNKIVHLIYKKKG